LFSEFHHNCSDNGEFDCYGDGTQCISQQSVCDGRPDCQHQEDEATALCKSMYTILLI